MRRDGTVARIPGLPDNLAEVPVGRADWLDWRTRVLAYRHDIHEALIDPKAPDVEEMRRIQTHLCTVSPAYFLTIYGHIFEPRRRFVTGWVPFIPFAYQVDLLDTIEEAFARGGDIRDPRGDIVVEKSRDMGATWIFCSWVLHGWLFRDGFLAGLVSYRESEVDDGSNPKAMFPKIEGQIDLLPGWMVPDGYRRHDDSDSKFRQKLKITHPTKTNVIHGESTTKKSGRGGRATVRINDEAAFIPNLNGVLTAQAPNTDHRFILSTASLDEGPDFRDLVEIAREAEERDTGDAPVYVRLDHWLHPFHDSEWLEAERLAYLHDPDGFLREVLIDYTAGQGEWVYPQAREIGPHPEERFKPEDPTYVAMDPGHDDDTAIVWVQWRPDSGRHVLVEGYANRRKPADFYASILTGIPDEQFRHVYTDEDERIMDWTKTFKAEAYMGDPYGGHRHLASGQSFYDRVELAIAHHHGGPKGILRSQEKAYFGLPERRLALHEGLLNLDVVDAPGPKRVLNALQGNRYPTQREGREGTTVPGRPIHDHTSHFTAAMEFWAVWRVSLQAARTPRAKPKLATFGVYPRKVA
jgi:hypothetical protein